MSMAVGGGFRATRMTPPTLGISQIGRAHVCFSDLIWAIGLVVSLAMLREVLKGMNVDGRRWWISSDPHDAADAGYLTIAHGTKGCVDRLNTLHFRVPVNGPAPGPCPRA